MPLKNASILFKLSGATAIIAGGIMAAAIAYHATQPLVWAVAYLVLVVGVVQYGLGSGEANLAGPSLSMKGVWLQWALWNLGHAGVLAGTLMQSISLLIIGTIGYNLAMISLAYSVIGGKTSLLRLGYWLLILLMFISSITGLVINLVTG